MKRRVLQLAILSVLVLLIGLSFSSCSKPSNETAAPVVATAPTKTSNSNRPCFTGVFLNRSQMVTQCTLAMVSFPLTQADSYAVVSYQWLSTCLPTFQQELFDHGIQVSSLTGVSGWATTFNCVAFSRAFQTFAAEHYHTDSRFVAIPPPFLAICTVNYIRDTDARYAASLTPTQMPELHQILLVITDRGPVWFDPQIGITTLTFTELNSISFKQA